MRQWPERAANIPSAPPAASPAPISPVRPGVEYRKTRTVYPFSVIRGGVFSGDELRQALLEDPIAAAHYADFRRDAVRSITASEPRLMYASYRVGNDVFWTSRPLHIAAGEALMTDGVNLARGRCGNLLSDSRRLPVGRAEPDEAALDQPEPAAEPQPAEDVAYQSSSLPLNV